MANVKTIPQNGTTLELGGEQFTIISHKIIDVGNSITPNGRLVITITGNSLDCELLYEKARSLHLYPQLNRNYSHIIISFNKPRDYVIR